MKLFELNYKYTKSGVILEGYGRRYKFRYTGDEVNDPRPDALSLGRFISPKNNQLMAGINLNYLSPQQITRLQQNLPNILKDKNLRRRARKLRTLMPDIFNRAYRTYKRDEIRNVAPDTLKYVDPYKDLEDVSDVSDVSDEPAPTRPAPTRPAPTRPSPDPDVEEPEEPEKPEKPEKPEESEKPEEPEDKIQPIKPVKSTHLDDIDDVDIEDEESI